jgi:hypothetical protein
MEHWQRFLETEISLPRRRSFARDARIWAIIGRDRQVRCGTGKWIELLASGRSADASWRSADRSNASRSRLTCENTRLSAPEQARGHPVLHEACATFSLSPPAWRRALGPRQAPPARGFFGGRSSHKEGRKVPRDGALTVARRMNDAAFGRIADRPPGLPLRVGSSRCSTDA